MWKANIVDYLDRYHSLEDAECVYVVFGSGRDEVLSEVGTKFRRDSCDIEGPRARSHHGPGRLAIEEAASNPAVFSEL